MRYSFSKSSLFHLARLLLVSLCLLAFASLAAARQSAFHDAMNRASDPVLSGILVVTLFLIGGVIAFVAVPYMWERSNGTRSLWQSVCRLERENRRLREKLNDLRTAHSATPSTIPATTLRMLIVDPDTDSLYATASILRQSGYLIETAASGYKAIELVRNNDYDLILMDAAIADTDSLNESPLSDLTASAPIVALSNDQSRTKWPHWAELGIKECIAKPVNITHLLEILDRSLPQSSATSRSCHS